MDKTLEQEYKKEKKRDKLISQKKELTEELRKTPERHIHKKARIKSELSEVKKELKNMTKTVVAIATGVPNGQEKNVAEKMVDAAKKEAPKSKVTTLVGTQKEIKKLVSHNE